MCLSKKPRCSSATRRRRNRHRAASPGRRDQRGYRERAGSRFHPHIPSHPGWEAALLAASTSFSTSPPLASVSTESQSLTRKQVLWVLCRSLTMTCCRNQAGLSPAERRNPGEGCSKLAGHRGNSGTHPDLCCHATHGSSTPCPDYVGWQSGRCPGCSGGRLCLHLGAGGHSGCPLHTA